MHATIQNLLNIKSKVNKKFFAKYILNPILIAVSKTFKIDHISNLPPQKYTLVKIKFRSSRKMGKIKRNRKD